MKKIVIKVNINCQLCKVDVLKTVAKLTGIDSLAVDGEKGTLTVLGDVDPALVVERLRKAGKTAEIISVGPPPKPEVNKGPKDPAAPIFVLPPSCNQCQVVAVYGGGISCHIL